ncbi:MAG: hypothetical protein EOP53_05285 [Sphingobacteriales bacterium]|nr:MAG: hypothetical protein EOP53_05285 [Sphingobacteriales bacterium]
MKKIFLKAGLIFTLFVAALFVNAQQSFRVTYASQTKHSPSTSGPVSYDRIILTDSALYHFPANSPKPQKNKLIYGNKIKHHFMYYFSNGNEYYFGNNFRSKPYVSKSLPRMDHNKWIVDTTITHYYKEYKCATAFKIKSPGDTIFVAYTPDIKYPTGLNWYDGLPGLVVETFDTSTGYYETVIRIEKGNYQIQLPAAKFIKKKKK